MVQDEEIRINGKKRGEKGGKRGEKKEEEYIQALTLIYKTSWLS